MGAGFGELHRNETSPWRIVARAALAWPMILLTGATGTVGSALLRRLVAAREPVRCLRARPARLGPERVRVQIALGDLADPASFRNALRGVDTVIHLAASIRDQPRGLDRGAERGGHAAAGAGGRAPGRRAVRASSRRSGPRCTSRTRFFRAKALAEQAVESADLATTVFAPVDRLLAAAIPG